jgi:ATP-dependent RNA helicase DDX21
MQGKTLAFVLPILESLVNGPAKASRKTGYGRPPSVLVLLPTRELATQVSYNMEDTSRMLTFDMALLYSVMCVLFRCLKISKFMVEQWA